MSKKFNVLLIDDDTVHNFLVSRILDKLDSCSCFHICKNGEEGVQYLLDKQKQNLPLPSFILLDLKMPVMDGYDFLNDFWSIHQNSETKIIAISTIIGDADKVFLKENGIEQMVLKPLTKDKIISLLK